MALYKCKLFEEGCNESFSVQKDADKHTLVCPFFSINCPQGCGQMIPKKDLVIHMATLCENLGKKCEYCQEEFPGLHLATHHENCHYRLEICTHCKNQFLRKDLELHLSSCLEISFPCRMKACGCNFEGKADVRIPHENDLGLHLPLLCSSLNLNTESITEKLQDFRSDVRNDVLDVKDLCTSLYARNETLEKKIVNLTDENKHLQSYLNNIVTLFMDENKKIKKEMDNTHEKQSNDIQNLSIQLKEMSNLAKGSNFKSASGQPSDSNNKEIMNEIDLIKKETKEVSKFVEYDQIRCKETQNIENKIDLLSNNISQGHQKLSEEINNMAHNYSKGITSLTNDTKTMLDQYAKMNETLAFEIKNISDSYLKEAQKLISKFDNLSTTYSKENQKLSEEIKDASVGYSKESKNLTKEITQTADKYCKNIQEVACLVNRLIETPISRGGDTSKLKDLFIKHCKEMQDFTIDFKTISSGHSKEIETLIREIWDMSTNYLRELQGLKKETQNLISIVKDGSSRS